LKEMKKAQELDPKLIDTYMKRGKYYLMKGESSAAEKEFRTAISVNPDKMEIRTALILFLIKEKRYDNAIKICREGMKNNTDDAFLFNLMGIAYQGKKDTDSARNSFEKSMSLSPKFTAPYINVAKIYLSEGKSDKAIEQYDALLKIVPGNLDALLASASLLEKSGKDTEAFNRYAKAKYTNYPAGYMALAAYYVRKNDFKHGIDTLKELLSRKPKIIEARDELAAIYLKKNNLKEAEAEYKEIINLTPNIPFGHNRLASVYIKSGNDSNAIAELNTSLKLNSNQPEIINTLAGIYVNKKDFKMAEDVAQKTITAHPDGGFGYHLMADIQAAQKNYEKALQYYEKAEKVSRNNFLSPMAAGNIYLIMGKTAKALEAYKRAEKANPRHPAIYFYQGSVFERFGEKNKAIERYVKSLSLDPNYVPSINNLAYLYSEKRDRLDEAQRLAERAKKIAPKDGVITDTLGWVYYKKGDSSKAITFLKEAVSLSPNEPTIRYHLGLAYIRNGMNGEARKEIEGALKMTKHFPDAEEAKKILKGLSQ